MTEGMVSEWFIADGAKVKKGEMLYSLETEKVNLDVDAEMDGYVKHTAEAGVMLAPGDVVGYIFADDEPIPADFAGDLPAAFDKDLSLANFLGWLADRRRLFDLPSCDLSLPSPDFVFEPFRYF